MTPGVDFGEFRQALLDAFDEKELEMLVRFRLNKRLGESLAPDRLITSYFSFSDGPSEKARPLRSISRESPTRMAARMIISGESTKNSACADRVVSGSR